MTMFEREDELVSPEEESDNYLSPVEIQNPQPGLGGVPVKCARRQSL